MRRRVLTRLATAVATAAVVAPLAAVPAFAQEGGDPEVPQSEAEKQAEEQGNNPDDDEATDDDTLDALDGLGALAAVALTDPGASGRFEAPAVDFHVTILSTGVDLDALGSAADDITVLPTPKADGFDHVGWGTWAASIIAQAAPGNPITVVDVYPKDRPSESALAAALRNIDPAETDAVLLAIPPADIIDPSLRALATGRSTEIFDAVFNTILTTDDGEHVVGTPLNRQAQNAAEYVGGWADKRDVRALANSMTSWENIVSALDDVQLSGLPVIIPAGDTGPGPQSVLGLAGLDSVITVAATDLAGTVAPTSARGPSLHGTVKPDVASPVAWAGVLPQTSTLATNFAQAELLDANLPMTLDGASGTRTATTSTLPAAATITAAAAALHADGADPERIRGQLYAHATPNASRDVLAQGAGVLDNIADVLVTTTRPSVSGPLDLGMEPAEGEQWISSVTVFEGSVSHEVTELEQHVGTDFTGRRFQAEVGVLEQPEVFTQTASAAGRDPNAEAATVRDGRLSVYAIPGENDWKPGVFCGYTRVTIVGTSNEVDTQSDVGTGPVSVPEDVPTCLVEGMRFDILSFYIHNMPVQNFTATLSLDLPSGASVLNGPMMVLPVNPIKEKLYAQVSGPDGYSTFNPVLPGFYNMRQFSDYSIDVTEDHPNGTIDRNIGNPLTYASKHILLLPDVCRIPREQRSGVPEDCHLETLREIDAVVGDGHVGYEINTGRYMTELPGFKASVADPEVGPEEYGIVMGWMKKSANTVVSSRYIDVHNGSDWITNAPKRTTQEVVDLVADLSQLSDVNALGQPVARTLDGATNSTVATAANAAGLGKLWTFATPPTDGDPLVAQFSGLTTSSNPYDYIGMADYPFSMTTPNYKGSFDWNFNYELTDAAMVAIVRINKERHVAVFTPHGAFTVSPITTEATPDALGTLEVSEANGVARLLFHTHPRGASQGLITLMLVPMDPLKPASVEISDSSKEITTWQRIEWPPLHLDRDGEEVIGHRFRLRPNHNTRQMTDQCRAANQLSTGGVAGDICEEWQVFIHSPKHDAETFRIVDDTTGVELTDEIRPAGGKYYDFQHGVTDATLSLAHNTTVNGLVEVDQGVRKELRSNGAFFETLHIPSSVIADHPTQLRIDIQDDVPGEQFETIAGRTTGSIPLAPYLRNLPAASHASGGLAGGLGDPNDAIDGAIGGDTEDDPTESATTTLLAPRVLSGPDGPIDPEATNRVKPTDPDALALWQLAEGQLWCSFEYDSNGIAQPRTLGAGGPVAVQTGHTRASAPPPGRSVQAAGDDDMTAAAATLSSLIDSERQNAGVATFDESYDLTKVARALAADAAAAGVLAPTDDLDEHVCCSTAIYEVLLSAEIKTTVADALADAVATARQATDVRADLLAGADHIGVAVQRDDHRVYAVVLIRNWDGSPLDTTPPALTIDAPVEGDVVAGTITADGFVGDDWHVESLTARITGAADRAVEFVNEEGWTFDFDTTELSDGIVDIELEAVDSSQHTTTVSVSVEIDNLIEAPNVAIESPTDDAVARGTVQVTGFARDDRSVEQATLTIAGNAQVLTLEADGTFAVDVDTTAYPDGDITINLGATDNANLTSFDAVTFEIDNVVEAPTVNIATPTDGDTVNGTIAVSGAVADDRAVASVEASIDGGPAIPVTTDETGTYSFDVNTLTYGDGPVSITVTARDADGLAGSDTVTVNVDNINEEDPTDPDLDGAAGGDSDPTGDGDTSGTNPDDSSSGDTSGGTEGDGGGDGGGAGTDTPSTDDSTETGDSGGVTGGGTDDTTTGVDGSTGGRDREITAGEGDLNGTSAIHTAVLVSQELFTTTGTVIIASTESQIASIAAAPLAGAMQAPVLLNPVDVGFAGDGDGIHPTTQDEIVRLAPERIILLGDTTQLGPDVATEARLLFPAALVERIDGSEAQIAGNIAERVFALTTPTTRGAILVGHGQWFDAAAASAMGGGQAWPILTTSTNELDEATLSALEAGGVTFVQIVANTDVVSNSVSAELQAMGITVDRISNAHWKRSGNTANKAWQYGQALDEVWVADGRDALDALVAGSAAAITEQTLVLVHGVDASVNRDTFRWLRGQKSVIQRVTFVATNNNLSAASRGKVRKNT